MFGIYFCIMKKMAFIFAMLVFFKPVIPVIEYIVDYDYIATVLCENKEKPQMHCNGKCHLMKELAKASETEKPQQSEKKNIHHEMEVLFFQETANVDFSPAVTAIVSKPVPGYSNLYSHTDSASIFHPPIFIG